MEVLIIIGLLIVGMAAAILLPQWRIRRAVPQVIKIFRKNNATTPQNAQFVDVLGLQKRGILEGMMRTRDYKPLALDALMKLEIVLMTDDGRIYLAEDILASSPLKRKLNIPPPELS